MNILINLIFLFFFVSFFSQKKFASEIEARYELDYKLKNTKNAPIYQTTFILLANKNESYFKSMNVYVGDSLKYYKKLKETGNVDIDYKTFSPYHSDFMENIGITQSKIYVSLNISNKNFEYEELNNFNWKLKREFKKIGDFNCQRAEIVKYGRTWIAYFCADIPFQYGPYKFGKLPGLIIELFDEKNDYHYKLYRYRKRESTCDFANFYINAKKVQKEKVFNYRKNVLANPNRFNNVINDPEMLQKLRSKSVELAKTYNPIGLKIE